MQIDIVIPSKNRYNKLTNCLISIEKYITNNIVVYVYFSSQKEIDSFDIKKDWLIIRLYENYIVPEFWNSHLKQCRADIMVCLNDDVLLKENTILEIEKAFMNNFPNFDGVVGLRQSNGPQEQCLDSAFCCIGLKYAQRFPQRQVYCINYKYFWADKELGDYAKKINKFYFAEKAEIIHLHPSFTKEIPDETHLYTRQYLMSDKTTYLKRKQLGYLWGENFNRINV